MIKRWIFLTLAILLAGGMAFYVGASEAPQMEASPAQQAPENYQAEKEAALTASYYVGSKICSGCHKDHYDGWRSTIHPYKIQEANDFTVVGDFIENNELTAGGYTTRMSTSDGKYYVTTLGPDNEEGTYEVKYTIGGIWKQRYITEFPNGALKVLPVQWNVVTKEWVDYHGLKSHQPGDGDYWSDNGRIWQIKCGSCHVTGLQINYDEANDTFASTWVDGGAGCEACHGPGSEHVFAPMSEKADTIINPDKLPSDRKAAMICGQCHSRGSSKAAAPPVPEGPGNYGYPGGAAGYMPGLEIDHFYNQKPGLWPDGSSKKHHQQYNDYLKSKHFEEGVACWDCHTTHTTGEGTKYTLKKAGDELCMDCHREISAKGSHAIHTFGLCVGCHMPKTAKTAVATIDDVAYDIHSHTFAVVSPEESIAQGGVSNQPNSCNACHYHKDASPEEMLQALNDAKANR
jgi:predicted CXXCH cytochrome family protein